VRNATRPPIAIRRSFLPTWTVSLTLVLVLSDAALAAESSNRVTSIRVNREARVVKAERGNDGTIHLMFNRAGGPRYASSRDGGKTFGPPLEIVDTTAQKPGLEFSAEDMAVGPDGRVHVALANNAWKLKLPQEEWGFYYATLASGAKAFSPLRNLNRKPSEGFSLAAGERGWVTAGFLSGKLFTMISTDGGENFSAWAELSPAWDPCDCCTTSAAHGADGRLALLYREETNNERDIYVALWDPRGERQPSRTRVSQTPWKVAACPMTYFTIARAGAGYVAAWPTKGQVYFARLDADGRVLPPGEIRTPGTTGMRMGLLALNASDGTTLIAWKHQEVLGWQLYDHQGQPQGDSGSVDSPGNGAAGVVSSEGRFILFP
jgi:hypothetical protein